MNQRLSAVLIVVLSPATGCSTVRQATHAIGQKLRPQMDSTAAIRFVQNHLCEFRFSSEDIPGVGPNFHAPWEGFERYSGQILSTPYPDCVQAWIHLPKRTQDSVYSSVSSAKEAWLRIASQDPNLAAINGVPYKPEYAERGRTALEDGVIHDVRSVLRAERAYYQSTGAYTADLYRLRAVARNLSLSVVGGEVDLVYRPTDYPIGQELDVTVYPLTVPGGCAVQLGPDRSASDIRCWGF